MKARLALFLAAPALVLAAEPPIPQFRAVTIDDKIQIGYGLAIADVDGDKRPDILLADKRQIVWYRNPFGDDINGSVVWQKHVIAENLTEKDNVCIAAQDIDGDGKCEIAVGAEWNPGDTEKSGAVFYLIPPADRTQRWEPVKFPSVEPTTHRMKWIKLEDGTRGLVVVPLHGRGNKNGEGATVKVLLYHKPDGDPHAEWKSEVIDESMHMTHNFWLSSTWIMLGGKEAIVSLRRVRGKWERRLFMSKAGNQDFAGAGEVAFTPLPAGDVPQPLVVAVEPMHGNMLVVYATMGESKPSLYARRVLTRELTEGHALKVGDLLNGATAMEQIVVGWRGKVGAPDSTTGVAVWTALDSGAFRWRETVIDPNGMACEDLQLADLDGDGRLDIIAAGRATKNVKIYFNTTTPAGQ